MQWRVAVYKVGRDRFRSGRVVSLVHGWHNSQSQKGGKEGRKICLRRMRDGLLRLFGSTALEEVIGVGGLDLVKESVHPNGYGSKSIN